MANPLVLTCPDCQKQIKAPAEAAGKKIRCKSCGCVFPVPGGDEVDLKLDLDEPRPAPAKAKAAPVVKAPAKPAAKAPAKPAAKVHDDLEADNNPFNITTESDSARCPHCALELDPPDARICLHCGYDTISRRRHESKKTYDITGMDYFMHLLPGIACVLGIIGLAVGCTLIFINRHDIMKDSWMEMEPGKYLVKPGIMPFYAILFSSFAAWKMGTFAFKRLVLNYKPKEVVKH